MLSLASVPAADTMLAFDGGFTPWKLLEHFFEPNSDPDYSALDLSCYHVGSESGSYDPNQKSSPSNPDSNQNSPTSVSLSSSGGSEDPNQNSAGLRFGSCYNDNDRERKRKMSNRESARRSRRRKQSILENLVNQVNRLKMENRELVNRLRFVNHHNELVRSDNDRFIIESHILQRRLLEIIRLQQLLRRQN